jgi:putative membrane protein
MIVTEKGEYVPGQGSLAHYRYIFYAFLVFLLSGLLGIFAFGKENMANSLFESRQSIDTPSSVKWPVWSFPADNKSDKQLSDSSTAHFPHQSPANRIIKAIFSGSVCRFFCSLASREFHLLSLHAGRTVRRLRGKQKSNNTKSDDPLDEAREFIVSVSGVNTANAVFGLFVFFFIGRARNGAIVAISSFIEPSAIDIPIILILLCVVILASIFFLLFHYKNRKYHPLVHGKN